MASVHQYIIDAEQFINEIKQKQIEAELENFKRYKHVVRIQALYRGYRQRKHLKKINKNVITIQKYIRGFLARLRFNKQLHFRSREICAEYYNGMAIVIQKTWRGYYARTRVFNYIKLRDWMRRVDEKNKELSCIDFGFEKLYRLSDKCQYWVMFIVFKLHHLLSTSQVDGIYSKNRNVTRYQHIFQAIETMIRSLKYSKYMKETRKHYEIMKHFNHPRKLILGERLKRCEEHWRLRNEYRSAYEPKISYNVDRKCKFLVSQKTPLSLPKKFSHKFYFKDDQFLLGPYEQPIRQIVRDIDTSKQISSDIFKSYSINIKTFPNAIDYYVDMWDKLIFCEEHHIPNPYGSGDVNTYIRRSENYFNCCQRNSM